MAELKSETTTFNGIKFYRYPDSGNVSDRKYFRAFPTRRGACIYLHRVMWEHVNGDIPDGFDIHHIDGNWLNNSIDNFECIPQSAHMSNHSKQWHSDPENKKNVIKHLDEIRPLTKEWHASKEGIEWHREHAKKSINSIPHTIHICEFCGDEYMSPEIGHNRFCTNACKSAWRRKSGVDLADRVCVVCGEVFKTNKYVNTKTCSPACRRKLTIATVEARRKKNKATHPPTQ